MSWSVFLTILVQSMIGVLFVCAAAALISSTVSNIRKDHRENKNQQDA